MFEEIFLITAIKEENIILNEILFEIERLNINIIDNDKDRVKCDNTLHCRVHKDDCGNKHTETEVFRVAFTMSQIRVRDFSSLGGSLAFALGELISEPRRRSFTIMIYFNGWLRLKKAAV